MEEKEYRERFLKRMVELGAPEGPANESADGAYFDQNSDDPEFDAECEYELWVD